MLGCWQRAHLVCVHCRHRMCWLMCKRDTCGNAGIGGPKPGGVPGGPAGMGGLGPAGMGGGDRMPPGGMPGRGGSATEGERKSYADILRRGERKSCVDMLRQSPVDRQEEMRRERQVVERICMLPLSILCWI